MSQFKSINSLGTTSVRMAAIKLKTANKSIFRALLSLASAALLVRLMGMVNQVFVSSRFGAGATMDAYFVASALPLLLGQLVINIIESSVTPVYARIYSQEKGGKERASLLFSTVLNLLLIVSVLLTLIMLIFRQQMILLSAPALDPFRLKLAISLIPFICPVLLLMVVIGFLESILNAEGQFGWPAYAGMLVPLTTAVLVLTVGKSLSVVVLCVGMPIGLCLQLCVFILRVKRAKLIYRFVLDLRMPEIGLILVAAGPAFLGAILVQVSPFVDQMFASFLPPGSISALSYALKINSVFTGVIFMSVGRAVLPYLSRQAAVNDMKAFKGTLRLYLWAIGSGTIVLSVLMLVLAHPLVQLLFQRGAFSAEETNRTATTFMGFAIGLTPMALNFVTSKAFNALGKNRVLMWDVIFTVIANAVFDYIFAYYWQGFGIALATSAVYFGAMFILFFNLRRIIGKLDLFTPPVELLQLFEKIGLSQNRLHFVPWHTESQSSFDISFSLPRQVVRMSIGMTVFAVGVVGVYLNSLYTLRLALGSTIILVFLRYRYALLIAWVLIDPLIGGSSLPIFNGNNFFTGLVVSTFLAITCLPVLQTLKRMPVLILLFIFIAWVFAGIEISPLGVGPFLLQWISYLNCAAIAMVTINVLTTRRRVLGLIDAILLTATFISLYGIYGFITKQNGVPDPATLFFRIFSVFGSSPTLALFLSIVIPLALYRTFTLRGFKRIISVIVVLIFLVALGLTFTRAALISVPLSIIIMILFLPSRKMRIGLLSTILMLSVPIALLATVANVPILSRFFNQDITTLNGRTYLWQAILDHFDPTQVLGKGLGASNIVISNLDLGNGPGMVLNAAHNLFLSTLYDQGIIGMILLILLILVLAGTFLVGMRKATGDRQTLFVLALAVLVNVVVQSSDGNDFWNEQLSIYFWIVMALPFAYYWFLPKQATQLDKGNFVDEVTQPQLAAIRQTACEQVSHV